jgi:putative tricarboxylic transport membrane protein
MGQSPMPAIQRLREATQYAIILCGAAYLWYVADHIAYAPIPGQMGPERWPKIIVGVLAIVCAIEIVRRLILPSATAVSAPQGEEKDAEDEWLRPKQTHIPLVFGTIVASIVYLVALDYCGFAFSTMIYSGCLMWLGGFRRLAYVAVLAVLLTLCFSFVFMKVIFVALPLGQGPFEKISLFVMSLVGVR